MRQPRDVLNGLILEAGRPVAAPVAGMPAATAPDIVGQLAQLKGLLDSGVLTQAEYDAKKAELLARR